MKSCRRSSGLLFGRVVSSSFSQSGIRNTIEGNKTESYRLCASFAFRTFPNIRNIIRNVEGRTYLGPVVAYYWVIVLLTTSESNELSELYRFEIDKMLTLWFGSLRASFSLSVRRMAKNLAMYFLLS